MSSRISKQKAEQFATTLLAKNLKEIRKLETELSKDAYDTAVLYIPSKVLEAYNIEVLREYFSSNTSVRFWDSGEKSSINLTMSSPLPTDRNSYRVNLKIQEDHFKVLSKKVDEISKKKKKLQELDNDLQGILIGLRTRKKVLEEFPLLENEWPEPSRFLPSNINKIKSQIL